MSGNYSATKFLFSARGGMGGYIYSELANGGGGPTIPPVYLKQLDRAPALHR
jgi:hypothetical protein